jgi:energy-coupling factor transporter ATP-binding protein EcfA2
MHIKFPPRQAGDPVAEFESERHFVVIGANGSGKTRLGVWIEEQNQHVRAVHRISAQKALSFPEYSTVRNPEEATKDLLYGRADEHASLGNKMSSRWGNTPYTYLLNDYEKVLSLLFARDAERNHQHTQATRTAQSYIPVPDSPIDSITRVWHEMMPHRSLSLEGGKVLVGKGTPTQYHGKDMSDGERVALYLLGQCVCAPEGSIVIVDEPELHMHKSLMDKFWNKVEELCVGKTLVYITHDLEFAASRSSATKIWVRSYDPNGWTWSEIGNTDELPESLLLEILGSRKPLLFCEGERGGLDHTIYQLCYPNVHVVPRGGSEKVAEATKALATTPQLHSFKARGIVDRDVRSDLEITALAAQGIDVLNYAEIENLLCTEKLVSSVATHLSMDGPAVVTAVTEFVKTSLSAELETQVVLRAERRIRYLLGQFSKASNDELGLSQGLEALVASVDISSIVATARKDFADAITSGSLTAMLRIYNRKTICDRISTCFGLVNGGYRELLLRLLNGRDAKIYLSAIQQELPSI